MKKISKKRKFWSILTLIILVIILLAIMYPKIVGVSFFVISFITVLIGIITIYNEGPVIHFDPQKNEADVNAFLQGILIIAVGILVCGIGTYLVYGRIF